MVPWTSVQYFLIGLYSCTSLLALLGNLTVILVSTLGSESAPTIRLCLANLAVSDIILAVLCVPFTFTDFMWGQCYCSQFSLQAIVATYFSCHWLAMANSAVNPIIYSWMSVNFRNDFRRITSSCRPGKSRALVKGSRHYSLKTASTMV
ncbi:PREDICTED: neuropeptide Y receptor type 4-like [Rhagoletis zephyria]|uniref:neuropeptide Y receptor type 4-like n=1 Tax=Rhagoletis zephyria TaxID=28612 RepID=UPI00081142D5|nr:PREDICTED: neuropeptide Y receptor type 4-like [Rhagoletis zephyria]